MSNTLIRLMIALMLLPVATSSMAAETSVEELLKKSEGSSASPFVSPLAAPLITPTAAQLPKTEQLKVLSPEKVTLSTEQTTPLIIRDAKEPLAGVKTGSSIIEKLVSADEITEASGISDENSTRTLTQFGYNYFQNLSLLPQIDIQVNADYLVGPGDSIVVTVWGSIDGSYDLVVNNAGEVVLPKVGPVRVAGLPFGKLPAVFRVHLSKAFRDFELAVNMGKLRTNKVSVVGEVVSPGDYTVSSLATVLNALAAAGGPTKNGSLRNITIRRTGKTEESIDLYDFFLTGDKRKDVRLSSGDTIFVPVVGRIAAVAGKVRRPAIYELKNETTLKDLLALAEGITTTGYLQQVQISRVIANQKKQVIDLDLESAQTGKTFAELSAGVPVQDMDIVKVFPINRLLRNHFKLEGHLERPGFYALKPGLRISSILNQKLLLPEYAPTIEVTRLYPPNLEPRKIMLDLEKTLAKDPGQDLEIHEFDTIKVFNKWKLQEKMHVKVNGEVQVPGEYPLLTGMTIRDLLIQAGNPKRSAYLKDAEISRLNLQQEKAQLQSIIINLEEVLKANPEHDITLQPFDELTVRRIPNWSEAKDRYVTLTGELLFPGTYPIYKGERLSSVILRAGGFTDMAYLKGVKFTREETRRIQQQRLDESLARAQEQIAMLQSKIGQTATSKEEADSAKATFEGLTRTVEILKTKKAEGRMIMKFNSFNDLKGGHYDLELQGGDSLSVAKDPGAINILGDVYNQTSIVSQTSKSVQWYLDQVGGATSEADPGEIYAVKVDGTVISQKNSFSVLFYNSFWSTSLDSGDSVVVPRKLEKSAWMRDVKDITAILANLAVSVGVVLVGLK